MRRANEFNTSAIKPHDYDPVKNMGYNAGGWKRGKSGLRPMKTEREEQVRREVEMRRQGA